MRENKHTHKMKERKREDEGKAQRVQAIWEEKKN